MCGRGCISTSKLYTQLIDSFVRRIGLDWRIPLYRKWLVYAQICANFADIIKYQRTGSGLEHLHLRGVGQVCFSSPEQALQMMDEIWIQRMYTRAFRRPVPQIVVDIGANIGLFTLYASKLWPGSQIHAYEPFPGNYRLLERNTRSIQPAIIQTYECAVAGEVGTASFFVKAESGWHSLHSTETENVVEQIEVPAISLAEVVLAAGGWIDFLKIDCEGCEWSLLSGRGPLLSRSVGYLAMEYHEIEGHSHQELVTLLQDARFTVQTTLPDAWHTGMIYAWNSHAHRPG